MNMGPEGTYQVFTKCTLLKILRAKRCRRWFKGHLPFMTKYPMNFVWGWRWGLVVNMQAGSRETGHRDRTGRVR